MPALFDIVLASFATYRLAQLLSKDDGPLDVFRRLRNFAVAKERQHSINIKGARFLFWHDARRWLDCPYCNGVAMAALCLALLFVPFGRRALAWLAIAGAQAFLQEIGSK